MRRRPQELAARHPLEERVLLGAEADVAVQARPVPRAMAQHPDLALAGPELARRQLQERALPRPVRAQQARDARAAAPATGCSGRSPARTTSIPSGTRPPAGSICSSFVICHLSFVMSGIAARGSSSQPVEPADPGRQDQHGGRRQPREHAGRPLPGIHRRAPTGTGTSAGATDADASGPDRGTRPRRPAGRRPGPNGPCRMGPRTSRRPTSPRLATRSQAVPASSRASRIRLRFLVYETSGHHSAPHGLLQHARGHRADRARSPATWRPRIASSATARRRPASTARPRPRRSRRRPATRQDPRRVADHRRVEAEGDPTANASEHRHDGHRRRGRRRSRPACPGSIRTDGPAATGTAGWR